MYIGPQSLIPFKPEAGRFLRLLPITASFPTPFLLPAAGPSRVSWLLSLLLTVTTSSARLFSLSSSSYLSAAKLPPARPLQRLASWRLQGDDEINHQPVAALTATCNVSSIYESRQTLFDCTGEFESIRWP